MAKFLMCVGRSTPAERAPRWWRSPDNQASMAGVAGKLLPSSSVAPRLGDGRQEIVPL